MAAIMFCGMFGTVLTSLIALPPTMRGPGNSPGNWLIFNTLLFGLGFYILGTPGRSWTRYAFGGWLRNGIPRWWKGVIRGGVFTTLAVAINELILRTYMESRRAAALSTGLSNTDVDALINNLLGLSYTLAAAAVLWSFIGDRFGRVVLPIERRRLLEESVSAGRDSDTR